MTKVDYLAIALYAAFMVAIGIVYTRSNKTSSDFFRAGGSLTWWLVGASAFVTLFSAWTFVGCAGRVFRTGTSTALIFLFNALALILTFYLAPKFRRLRVISWVEAVRLRFGKTSEQFFTMATTLIGLLFGGVALYTIAVFLSPAFALPTQPIIIGVSVVIILMTALGGAKAVMAADFIQSLFIVAVAGVIAWLVLGLPGIGGMDGLIRKSPEHIFDWTAAMRPEVLGLWGLALLVNQVVTANSLNAGASRYLAVRNERHARLAVLLPMAGIIFLPVIAFIPPIAGTILLSDIENQFPLLNNPSEASYVAIAMMALPSGMVGMLVVAIFAATLTSLNTGLAAIASVITRNAYLIWVRPNADERELLLAGRIFIVVCGLLMMGLGLGFQTVKDLPLFELTLAIAGLIGMPMTVPLVLGIFIRRTPGWSAWGTVVFGTSLSSICWFVIPAPVLASFLGFGPDLPPAQLQDVRFAITLIVATLGSVGFFLFSMSFASKVEPAECATFFERMRTPIDEATEVTGDNVARQARTIGVLGLVYGSGVAAFGLFAGSHADRMPFFVSGGLVILVCLVLFVTGLRDKTKNPIKPTEPNKN